jgi:putative ABC transport system substrate-binding protein
MRRRGFIGLMGGVVAWPFAARAQQAASVRRIGFLSPFSPVDTRLWNKAFLQGLRDAGWVDGKNITIEYRYAEGRIDRLPALIADLIQLKVEIIVTNVTVDTLAAKSATTEIPIVMLAVGDPVAVGIVKSLGRPGGNITGLSQMTPDLTGKRMELLKEIVPKISSVAVLFNPEDPLSVLDRSEAQLSAQKLGIEARSLEVRSTGDFDTAFEETARSHAGAVVVMPSPVFFDNLSRIADFAKQNQLPSTFHLREFAVAGGLVSYGVDRSDLFRRSASYVDKILKGAKPADLPIEQPTKFELAINLKTAKAIGLTIPPNVLGIADEVIE